MDAQNDGIDWETIPEYLTLTPSDQQRAKSFYYSQIAKGNSITPERAVKFRSRSASMDRGIDIPLSPLQRKCLQLKLQNPTIGYRAIGSLLGRREDSVKMAMKKTNFRHTLAVEAEKYAKAADISRRNVVDGFKEAIEMARLKAEPLTMIAGWREIGKICGLYEPSVAELKVSVSGQVAVQNLQKLSDAELLKLAQDPTTFQVLDAEFSEISNGSDSGEPAPAQLAGPSGAEDAGAEAPAALHADDDASV